MAAVSTADRGAIVPAGAGEARAAAALIHQTDPGVWDYLFRGDELFPVLEAELRERFPGVDIVGFDVFGNLHGSDEKERIGRLPDDLRTRGVDAVVSGMGC